MKKTNALIAAMQTKNTTTANGAVSHSTTGTAVLNFFSKGAAMRQQPETEIVKLFSAAYKEDKTYALKALFNLGEIRGGQGERRLFKTCFNWLANNDAKVATKLLKQVPEFTRWDYVVESTENTPVEEKALKLVANQLLTDIDAETPTLVAKWSCSENASSDNTRRIGGKIRKTLGYSPKQYRKLLSGLRERINVVERAMCSGDWKKIDFQAVPSRASMIYKNAFLKHAPVQYNKFLTKVEKGEAKINASTLYPYDLVRGIFNKTPEETRVIEAQWKALPDYCAENPMNALVALDLSGSMQSGGNGTVTPMDVALSLGVYFSERTKGPFNGYVIPFSRNARLVNVVGNNLKEKVQSILHNQEVANTNLMAVFNLILNHAVNNNVKQTEMPETLYLISDCAFDSIVDAPDETNLEAIKRKYKQSGYKLPKIVFWNVNAQADSPAKHDDKNVALVSGCSPTIFKSALGGKNATPWEAFLDIVGQSRYDVIKA